MNLISRELDITFPLTKHYRQQIPAVWSPLVIIYQSVHILLRLTHLKVRLLLKSGICPYMHKWSLMGFRYYYWREEPQENHLCPYTSMYVQMGRHAQPSSTWKKLFFCGILWPILWVQALRTQPPSGCVSWLCMIFNLRWIRPIMSEPLYL